ncbi:MAG: Uma2 family endonuclease [Bacteroidota bacterium]
MSEYKEEGQEIDDFAVLEPEGVYSYADYLRWTFEERVELIKGKIFLMSPAPATRHQGISTVVGGEIYNYLKNRKCKVFFAPFDVRLPNNLTDSDEETFTVIQPDISVICDLSKLDKAGCKGAPDLIVEILSPSTSSKDLKEKFWLYQEHKVKEYWVVYPGENIIELFVLNEKSEFESTGKFLPGDQIKSNVLLDFNLNLDEVFNQ